MSETSATWSVRSTGTPFARPGLTAAAERLAAGKCSNSQTSPTISSRSGLSSRGRRERGLTVVDASRRNCVHLATTRPGRTFVVKQASPRTASTLAHEADVLRVLADMPALAHRVPVVVCEEPDRARLVLRTPPARATGRTMPRAASRGSRRRSSAAPSRRCIASRATRPRAAARLRSRLGAVAAGAGARAAARHERRVTGGRRPHAGEPVAVPPARQAARRERRRRDPARRPALGQLPALASHGASVGRGPADRLGARGSRLRRHST